MEIYSVGYVQDSMDGMSLFSGWNLFDSYDKAKKFVEDEYEDTSVIDYVKNTFTDCDGEESELDLDIYNDGRECCGCVCISKETVD